MIIYGLKTCDTCRKARKALPEAEFVDVRESGVPADILNRALTEFGDKLVNTRSTTWRGFDEETRALTPEAVIRAHPTVMKRPLIVQEQRLVLGWDKAAQSALGVG
ncbi:ArsC/Spx/MgsR family protein [Mameliella sediminis]|uniref:ArsC/Spx/MgsR family protein n=1 Tax=Mameliella sediminis TaxID=2836866 RepID=UPI001C492771|nr:ArsC/Spx/MgsR family protein [Mameliella sediminis]MBV7393932.1 arsenate reductase [Mameliella sediminis]MBY6115878.1 arsenate reductase [Antarctobacter heliothermus]MBY6145344.1 arsenate reductase [Mameliella alba]MCA0955092.1 arsenate reductase [Mameliella alba]